MRKSKKLLAAALSAILVLSTAACGAKTSAPETTAAQTEQTQAVKEGIFTPGTYEAEAAGMNGPIKVSVTVDADKITAVEIVEHKETTGISDPAINQLPEDIVEQQTVALDAITGCTISSDAILSAVKAALISAGAKEADITKAPVKKAAADPVSKSADVIIIGTGGAGMSAAVEVLNAGGSVILIDKLLSTGGNTILAGSAMNAADPENQKKQEMSSAQIKTIENLVSLAPKDDLMAVWQSEIKADIEAYKAAGSTYLYDSNALHKLQTYVDGDYVGNPKLIDILGDHALESVDWLTGLGAQWTDTLTAAVGATWTRSHTPQQTFGSKGAAFVLPQQKAVEEKGGEILLGYKAEELIVDNGTVTGVKGTTTDGASFTLTGTKGVIIATGGFAANVEMRQKYNKHWATLDENVPTSNGPQATGDGIIMAEAIGANLVGMEWIQLVPSTKTASFTPAIDNTISVNKEGKRYVKEDGRRDELSKAILEQPDTLTWKILDSHVTEDLLGGVSYTGEKIEDMVDNKYVFKADSLEELAGLLGIPAESLIKTVDEFNSIVENGGKGDPTGRTLFDQKIDKPPFYAQENVAKIHHTMGGIEINEQAQVMSKDGTIIPGLYAAGEVTGGIHGANRLGGNAIADIITFGRIAGQTIMK